jgi:hypothetical protein
MNKNYKIKNIGKTKTLIYNGIKQPKKNDIEWSIDYDNKNGVDLNVNMNNDGDKSHYHQYLTNSELEELLKIPVVDKSIHQRLLEDFNPYNETNAYSRNNNLDLITYPRKNTQPYEPYSQYSYPYQYPDKMHDDIMHNDLMNFNQVPMFFQRPSELTKKSRPNVIKIKIYTKKHKKHSNKNRSKSNSRSSSQTKTRSSRSRRSNRIR